MVTLVYVSNHGWFFFGFVVKFNKRHHLSLSDWHICGCLRSHDRFKVVWKQTRICLGVTSFHIILTHHCCRLCSSNTQREQFNNYNANSSCARCEGCLLLPLSRGAPAHTFLHPSTAATQIKLWEASVCAFMCTSGGVCCCVCVFPAVASAGATGKLDSVCVSLDFFIRSSLQLQTGLIYMLWFNTSVSLCVWASLCFIFCMNLCVLQVMRGYCSGGLNGPPTEALSSEQQMEKERQGSQWWRDSTSTETVVFLIFSRLFNYKTREF